MPRLLAPAAALLDAHAEAAARKRRPTANVRSTKAESDVTVAPQMLDVTDMKHLRKLLKKGVISRVIDAPLDPDLLRLPDVPSRGRDTLDDIRLEREERW